MKTRNRKIESVTAAGGIVFRLGEESPEPEVLMIFRNGCWDLPKGKLEQDESIEMCAAREVAEEVGSDIPVIVKKVGTTFHQYPEKDKIIGKTTHWYSMIFTKETKEESFIPQKKEGIEQVKWVPLSEAKNMADFENLREILQTFGQ